jgi:archaemetzincin
VAHIALSWIGAGAVDVSSLESLRAHAERVFAMRARIRHADDRPADAFDPRRQQHSAARILAWLSAARTEQACKILGITDVDLFVPVLTFVYGEAELGGAAAVVSTARLSAPDSPAGNGSAPRSRLIKECIHELGHAFGLLHCPLPSCVMSRSVSLMQIDSKDDVLCPDCGARYDESQRRGHESHDQGTHARSRR